MRSIKQALLTYILAGDSIVVGLAAITVFVVARTNFRAQLDESLAGRAVTFASLMVQEDDELEFEYDQPIDEASIGILLRITTDKGTIMARSPDWPSGMPIPELDPGDEIVFKTTKMRDGAAVRYVALARFAARDPSGAAPDLPVLSDRVIIVEVIGRTNGVRRAESAVLIALVVGGLFAILGSIIAVWMGVRRGLVPVQQLGRAVDSIDTNDLALPPREGSAYPEELRPIVAALEGLLDRLRAAMERERRFTDAAAHELRTPIAELKVITDVADRWPDPDRLHRSIKDARIVIRQMEDLLENLLAVARGATRDGSHTINNVRLLPLARTLSREAVNRLDREDLSWAFEGDEDVFWKGSPAVIVAIVRNLIDNATEYTPAKGTVRIAAFSNDEATVLEIENGPVSLDPSQAERIFEPFWRDDSSRSERNHRGLGLTIVDTFARAMAIRREVDILSDDRMRIRLIAGNPPTETVG